MRGKHRDDNVNKKCMSGFWNQVSASQCEEANATQRSQMQQVRLNRPQTQSLSWSHSILTLLLKPTRAILQQQKKRCSSAQKLVRHSMKAPRTMAHFASTGLRVADDPNKEMPPPSRPKVQLKPCGMVHYITAAQPCSLSAHSHSLQPSLTRDPELCWPDRTLCLWVPHLHGVWYVSKPDLTLRLHRK